MPIALTTLFTTPQDIWDVLSVEGVDLREDDHNLATGQVITCAADASVGAVAITVSELPVALLRGAQLTFEGAGMEVPVVVSLTATALVAATTISVTALETAVTSGAVARDSGVNAATGLRLVQAARRGTSRVKLYCNGRYDDSQLALSGSVNNWATIAACKWLCTRRAQGCPKSIRADYDEMMEEMQKVQCGQLYIEDIGTRGSDWPTVSNITVNPAYNVMRARVQPSISEQSPTAYSQYIDWNSALAFEF